MTDCTVTRSRFCVPRHIDYLAAGCEPMIRVRPYRPEDGPAMKLIFRRAVLEGAASAYDEAQRRAWAAAAKAAPCWDRRLGDQITLVADRADRSVGFMTLGHDGHLDLVFVAPEQMGTGIAAALHDRLLGIAQNRGMTRLTTEASHLARRFFLRQGWRELARQQVTLGDVTLTNFRMDKRIAP